MVSSHVLLCSIVVDVCVCTRSHRSDYFVAILFKVRDYSTIFMYFNVIPPKRGRARAHDSVVVVVQHKKEFQAPPIPGPGVYTFMHVQL